jgi:hypothetical protein
MNEHWLLAAALVSSNESSHRWFHSTNAHVVLQRSERLRFFFKPSGNITTTTHTHTTAEGKTKTKLKLNQENVEKDAPILLLGELPLISAAI